MSLKGEATCLQWAHGPGHILRSLKLSARETQQMPTPETGSHCNTGRATRARGRFCLPGKRAPQNCRNENTHSLTYACMYIRRCISVHTRLHTYTHTQLHSYTALAEYGHKGGLSSEPGDERLNVAHRNTLANGTFWHHPHSSRDPDPECAPAPSTCVASHETPPHAR